MYALLTAHPVARVTVFQGEDEGSKMNTETMLNAIGHSREFLIKA